MNQSLHYERLAKLFRYPDEHFTDSVNEVQTFLNKSYTDAAIELKAFTNFVSDPHTSVGQLEEIYARSFEVQAITTLDLGYVLFGDDYKRGALMVHLNQEHREVNNECGKELADHLPNILRLLSKMKSPELREELVQKIVAPALQKIIKEFDPQNIKQKSEVYKKHHKTIIESSEQYGTIYQYPLKALYAVLKSDFELNGEIELTPAKSDFLKSVNTEMKLECEPKVPSGE